MQNIPYTAKHSKRKLPGFSSYMHSVHKLNFSFHADNKANPQANHEIFLVHGL